MIVITGGAGFIGSCLVWQLNEAGYDDIVVVDALGEGDKWKNLRKRKFNEIVPILELPLWLDDQRKEIEAIFHMGACSSTTEKDADFLLENNTRYSMELFNFCAREKIPYVYASSAATYGLGGLGYSDAEESIPELLPINKYGYSKQLFDCWVLKQQKKPPFWAGLKFFNVYGPQEYHKGSQASVVWHAFPQVKELSKLRLFKSYVSGIADGEQKRDFIYVKDVTQILEFFFRRHRKIKSGIYNIGTGEARTFSDLGTAVFNALNTDVKFEWIPMPNEIKSQYQYFTQADVSKLRKNAGYKEEFRTLEEGISDYIGNYLLKEDPFL